LADPYPIERLKKKNKALAYVALAIVCFFWGTTWIASKQGVKYMPALQMAGLRQLMGGSVYFIYFMGKGRVLPRGKEWWTVVILSLLSFVGSNGLSTWGVKYISAGLGSIIGAIFPIWLVIIGYTRSQKLSLAAILGIFMGFGGICVIFYEHMADFLNPDFSFGIFISLLATVCWALGTTFTKEKAADFNPYFSLGLQMMISGISLISVTNATGNTIPLADIPWQSWTAMGYLVTFGSVFSFTAYLYALQHLPIEQASIYAYINPIVAVLLGVWLFDEKFSVFIAVGGLIVLAGVYLVNRETFRKMKKQRGGNDQPAS
jgi:drug/metabolite transporter (DMT)-like permease